MYGSGASDGGAGLVPYETGCNTRPEGRCKRPAGLTGARGKAASDPAPLPAMRRTSLRSVSEFDQVEIRFAEIAAHMSQNTSVWVAIDGDG